MRTLILLTCLLLFLWGVKSQDYDHSVPMYDSFLPGIFPSGGQSYPSGGQSYSVAGPTYSSGGQSYSSGGQSYSKVGQSYSKVGQSYSNYNAGQNYPSYPTPSYASYSGGQRSVGYNDAKVGSSYARQSRQGRIGYSISKGHPHVSVHYQAQPSYGYKEEHAQPSYGHQDQGYGHQDQGYQQQQHSYQPSYHEPIKQEIVKIKKIYVPIVVKKRKKKKMKIISEYKGFYIEGGTQLFGKFKDVKSCKKACAITPTCFAGDYNPWLKKCYLHTNLTACENMKGHKSIWHFKKIPCQLVETPLGLITPGAQIFNAIEQKGIKSLSDCIKKCATAGGGIAPSPTAIPQTPQICFGIDYDFATHKCYFHIDSIVCPVSDPIPTPVNLVANPTVVNIIMCPLTTG